MDSVPMKRWIEYRGIPFETVIERGGTPFLVSPRTVLTASPTTAIGNYNPLFDPYPSYTLNTARILVRPDAGVATLRLERIHVSLKGRHQIQAVTGKVPMAGGRMEAGRGIALREVEKLRSTLELLRYALISGTGLAFYVFKLVLGASGSGWAEPWNRRFLDIFDRAIYPRRQPFKILLAQISTDLIVSDSTLERRIRVLRELMGDFDLRIFYSYPRCYENGRICGDPEETKRHINDVIAFIEYISSQENSDVSRQLTDLGVIYRDQGYIGYIVSPVMGLTELSRFMADPKSIRLLSPIPLRVERDSAVVLLMLSPTRDHAERYADEFRRQFRESEVVATYGDAPSGGEPKFLVAVPIGHDELERCLKELGRDRARRTVETGEN